MEKSNSGCKTSSSSTSMMTPQDAYAALNVDSDLLTRTSWTDARLALHQIKKVRLNLLLVNKQFGRDNLCSAV
jgi:hypothetical protein